MYPRWKHRGASKEELAKDPALYKSQLVHSVEEERQIGEGWHDHLYMVPEVRAVHHPEPIAMAPSKEEEMPIVPIDPPIPVDEWPAEEKPVVDMNEEELRTLLCEKHGWPKRKLAKKSKEQLLAIFSS